MTKIIRAIQSDRGILVPVELKHRQGGRPAWLHNWNRLVRQWHKGAVG